MLSLYHSGNNIKVRRRIPQKIVMRDNGKKLLVCVVYQSRRRGVIDDATTSDDLILFVCHRIWEINVLVGPSLSFGLRGCTTEKQQKLCCGMGVLKSAQIYIDFKGSFCLFC